MRTLLSLLLLIPIAASAQWTIGSRSFTQASSSGGTATFTIDGTGCTNYTTGSLSVACTLTQTSGDLITVSIYDHDGTGTGVSDGVNAPYTLAWYGTDSTNPASAGLYYFLSSTAATGNITVTYSLSEYSVGVGLFVQAWKPSSGSATLDSTFSSSFYQASTSGTVANGNCGAARTPASANELIVSYAVFDNVTPTLGTNYTWAYSGGLYTQYWIQTTATSTNGAFVSAADDWVVGCAAFKP